LTAPDAYNFLPMKHPLSHMAPAHTSPLPHEVPSLSGVHELVDTPGWQLEHTLPGLIAPDATALPAISQPLPHAPAVQTWPLPHVVPS
jgi:hypothetical protein